MAVLKHNKLYLIKVFLLSLCALGVILFGSFVIYGSTPIFSLFSPRVREPKLSEFRTVTVEVESPSTKIDNVLGYSDNELSEMAVKKICPEILTAFEGEVIGCGRFGKPYSFFSNPLNLSVIIEVWKVDEEFSFSLMFERSCLYADKKFGEQIPSYKQRYDKTIREGWSEKDAIRCGRLEPKGGPKAYRESYSKRINAHEQLQSRLEDIADELIDRMIPKADIATRIEEEMLTSRKDSDKQPL